MRYEGTLYRPPSEAKSLIVQVTVGCSHNRCSFCSMYRGKKFKVRKVEEVIEDLKWARGRYPHVKRIFLADGNALVLADRELFQVLNFIKKTFPECERVSAYASAKDILRKTDESLKEMRALGLSLLYLGAESGSQEILKAIDKGVSPEEMIEASEKLKKASIDLSVTLISGMGGAEKWQDHALSSAQLIEKINPQYLSFLSLLLEEGTPLSEEVKEGSFELLSPKAVLRELKCFLESLGEVHSIFRSNHASNYLSLAGTLPQDKERLLDEINEALSMDIGEEKDFYRSL